MNKALDAELLAVIMSTPFYPSSCNKHVDARPPRSRKWLQGSRRPSPHVICDLVRRESKASSLLGKARVFACPGNHHLETGAVTNKSERHCRKRLVICASRRCRSGPKYFLAGRGVKRGRATGMAAATGMLRRSVMADGRAVERGGEGG